MYELDRQHKALQVTLVENAKMKEKSKEVAFDESKLKENDHVTKYLTGLPSWQHLNVLVTTLSPVMTNSSKNALSKFQEIILVLMRLRLGLPLQLLAALFHIDTSTSCRIFHRVLNNMFVNLKWLVQWPDREILQSNLPAEFVKCFGERVTVIIDCFEVVIEKSHYPRLNPETDKSSRRVMKYLIGISPQGVITYISDKGWAGQMSDKDIVENSDYLSYLEDGDSVIVNGDCNIYESLGMKKSDVSISAFTCVEKQLIPWEVEEARKIAHLKTHIEKVIGCFRNRFPLLRSEVSLEYIQANSDGLTTLDKVVSVCAALTNLSENGVVKVDSRDVCVTLTNDSESDVPLT